MTFADPYGLHLDFETVRKIASVRSDLVVLLADNMDALRNWATYYFDNPNSSLDRFMGETGWRDVLTSTDRTKHAEALRERYLQRLRSLGYTHFAHERFQNSRGADIYSLVYATRHERGLDFWHKASEVDEGGQRSLPFDA
jgi:three-Cys-motif partner protein